MTARNGAAASAAASGGSGGAPASSSSSLSSPALASAAQPWLRGATGAAAPPPSVGNKKVLPRSTLPPTLTPAKRLFAAIHVGAAAEEAGAAAAAPDAAAAAPFLSAERSAFFASSASMFTLELSPPGEEDKEGWRRRWRAAVGGIGEAGSARIRRAMVARAPETTPTARTSAAKNLGHLLFR